MELGHLRGRAASTAFCRNGGQSDAGFPAEAAGANTDDRNEPVADRRRGDCSTRSSLPAAFVKTGWATLSLPELRGARRRPRTRASRSPTVPRVGDSADSEMWVVMSSGGVLFVDVTDDHRVQAAKSWVKADHLEARRARRGAPATPAVAFSPTRTRRRFSGPSGSTARCTRPTGRPVPPADGPRRPAPTTRARFRIVLPDEGKGLTVVYSDSDDGARQKRLIATSPLPVRPRPWTIGGVTPIGEGRATCVVDGTALRPKVTPLRRQAGLLLQDFPAGVRRQSLIPLLDKAAGGPTLAIQRRRKAMPANRHTPSSTSITSAPPSATSKRRARSTARRWARSA